MNPPNRTTPDDPAARRAPSVRAEATVVGAAVAAYGISYGVLAVASGLPPAVATLSSVLVLAGGSQFAFVAVLAAGGNPLTGAVGGLLLNLRLVAFGLAIGQLLPRDRLPRRLVDGYLVVDESAALALAAAGRGEARGAVVRRFRTVGVAVTVAWIAATALGAYGGQLIGDPERFGLDAAFPAGFLALLSPWLRTPAGRRAALWGAILAVATTPFAPPGVPLLAAGVGALAGWRHGPGSPATDVPPDPTPDTAPASTGGVP